MRSYGTIALYAQLVVGHSGTTLGKRVWRITLLTPSAPIHKSNLCVSPLAVFAVTLSSESYSISTTRESMWITAPSCSATSTSPSWRWARWTSHQGLPKVFSRIGMSVYPTLVPSLRRMFSSSIWTRLSPITLSTPHLWSKTDTLGVIWMPAPIYIMVALS